MREQMELEDLREDLKERYPRSEGPTDTEQPRARPAVSEAEVAPCECPELCLRDHENE